MGWVGLGLLLLVGVERVVVGRARRRRRREDMRVRRGTIPVDIVFGLNDLIRENFVWKGHWRWKR